MFVACHNKDCLNYGASYTVDEGDEETHTCSVCDGPLEPITEPDELLAPLIAEREAAAQLAGPTPETQEMVAAVALATADVTPSPRDDFLAQLDALPQDQGATVAQLAAALRL